LNRTSAVDGDGWNHGAPRFKVIAVDVCALVIELSLVAERKDALSPRLGAAVGAVGYVRRSGVIFRTGAAPAAETANSFILAILGAARAALVEGVQAANSTSRGKFANIVLADAATAPGRGRVTLVSKAVAVFCGGAVSSGYLVYYACVIVFEVAVPDIAGDDLAGPGEPDGVYGGAPGLVVDGVHGGARVVSLAFVRERKNAR